MKSALHTRWWPTVFSMFDQFWKVGIVSFAFSNETTARASRFRIFCETYIIIYIIINDVLSHNPACDVTRGFVPNGDLSRLLLLSALIFPDFFFASCDYVFEEWISEMKGTLLTQIRVTKSAEKCVIASVVSRICASRVFTPLKVLFVLPTGVGPCLLTINIHARRRGMSRGDLPKPRDRRGPTHTAWWDGTSGEELIRSSHKS